MERLKLGHGCRERQSSPSRLLLGLPWLLLLLLACQAAPAAGQRLEETGQECEEEERSFDSEVRVATLQLEELQVVLLVVVFILIVVFAKLVWHHHLMLPVSSNIPESCMLIVVGAHIGGIIVGVFYLEDCNRENELSPPFKFTPSLFFLYLLPPIVLEAGYFLNNRAFFENLPTILVYAVVGTIFNAFAVGLCLFGLFHAGIVLTGSASDVNFTLSSALLFGTICAAVDPVAVLAVFEEIHVNKMLHILVFGESLLNDAVTIVLFQVLGAFANRPLDSRLDGSEKDITVADGFLGVAQFVVVVVASLVIGLLMGMLGALFTRFTAHIHVLEPIVVFAVGYLSYILADLFAFSGIVSLIATAIVMRHYVEANISRKSHTTIKSSMKVLSNVAEMIIFLFLGISLYETSVHNWDTGLVICTIVLVLLFRPIGVLLLTLLMNIFRVKKISWKSMFIMSYSGLRGAVAFALALVRISDEAELRDPHNQELSNELKLRQSMLTAITALVFFTVFIQGTTIKPIVRWLKVRTEQEHKLTMNEAIHSTVLDHITAGMEDILGHVGHNRIREKIRDIDVRYLRKIFERYPEARDEEILHTFKRLQYTESAKAAEQNMIFRWHMGEGDGGTRVSLYQPFGSPEPQGELEHRLCFYSKWEKIITSHTYSVPLQAAWVKAFSSAQEGFTEGEVVQSELEDHIPQLNDILQASFISPHESHFTHILSRNERDTVSDHRFEPMAVQRLKIRSRHEQRQRRRRLGSRFRRSVFSGLSSPGHRLPSLNEEDGITQEDGIEGPRDSKPEEVEIELHETQDGSADAQPDGDQGSESSVGPIPVSTGLASLEEDGKQGIELGEQQDEDQGSGSSVGPIPVSTGQASLETEL